MKRLVLYEPPLPAGGPVAATDDLREYRNAIEAGDPDRALEIGYTRFARIAPERVRLMRSAPDWQPARALAGTWLREAEQIEKLGNSLDRYRAIQTPTLLLVGSESAPQPATRCDGSPEPRSAERNGFEAGTPGTHREPQGSVARCGPYP